jgi:predicted transcriptional regulator
MTPEQRLAVMQHATATCEAIIAERVEGAGGPKSKPVHVEGGQTYWLTPAEYRRFVNAMRTGGPVVAPNRASRRKMAKAR